MARPYGRLQLRGSFLPLWEEILPPVSDHQWRESLGMVAAWLAEFGGRALVEPPRIDWQSPASFAEIGPEGLPEFDFDVYGEAVPEPAAADNISLHQAAETAEELRQAEPAAVGTTAPADPADPDPAPSPSDLTADGGLPPPTVVTVHDPHRVGAGPERTAPGKDAPGKDGAATPRKAQGKAAKRAPKKAMSAVDPVRTEPGDGDSGSAGPNGAVPAGEPHPERDPSSAT
jgi:hypothetical protein